MHEGPLTNAPEGAGAPSKQKLPHGGYRRRCRGPGWRRAVSLARTLVLIAPGQNRGSRKANGMACGHLDYRR
jgi:hypothetical protein